MSVSTCSIRRSPDPVRVINVEYTKTNGGYQWFIVDLYLAVCISDKTPNAGGSRYLCYDQNSLPPGMEAESTYQGLEPRPVYVVQHGQCVCSSGASLRGSIIQIISLVRVPCSERLPGAILSTVLGTYRATSTRIPFALQPERRGHCWLRPYGLHSSRSATSSRRSSSVRSPSRCCALRVAMNPDVRVNRNSRTSRVWISLYELDGNSDSQRRGRSGLRAAQGLRGSAAGYGGHRPHLLYLHAAPTWCARYTST